MNEQSADSSTSPTRVTTYTAGTLCYDRRGLGRLFLWLLWGDFAFNFFEVVFSRFMPLYLKDLQVSNTIIGIMMGSIAGAINILFAPNISLWSDRLRTSLGRRIPLLLWCTPLTVLSLILIGFAPEIGGWFHGTILGRWMPQITKHTTIIVFLCLCVVSYHFFNMVLNNAYNWLLRDVVPQSIMARFIAWFRIVGTIATSIFLLYIFPYALEYRQWVCAGVGTFYFVMFMLMCWQVREGEYPSPPPRKEKRHGILSSYISYFKECLRIPIYRYFFLASVFAASAISSANPFLVLFARENLKLPMDDIGRFFAWGALISTLSYFPLGWLSDRYGSLKVAFSTLLGCVLVSGLAFFLVHNKNSWMIYMLFSSIAITGWWLAQMAVMMILFPKEEFGQFASGINVFGCGAYIISNYLAGYFMDIVHDQYKFIFLWSTLFFALSLIPLWIVYREWKRHGGPHHYVPPLP